jgi:hypothetical protein
MNVASDLAGLEATVTECIGESNDIQVGINALIEMSKFEMTTPNLPVLPGKLADTMAKTQEMLTSSTDLNVKITKMKEDFKAMIDSLPSLSMCCPCLAFLPNPMAVDDEGECLSAPCFIINALTLRPATHRKPNERGDAGRWGRHRRDAREAKVVYGGFDA